MKTQLLIVAALSASAITFAGCIAPITPALPPAGAGPALTQPAVTVADQNVTANTVMVDGVVAAEPGWIVIHADAAGKPGPVVGYAAVAVGENMQVMVTIDAAQATPQLYAMLHVDKGVVGTYEFPGADAPVMLDGKLVSPAFAAQAAVANAPQTTDAVEVADQEIVNATVTVPMVNAVEDGWIAIHADADGKPGPVIGHAQVKAGMTLNLVVEIEAAKATPKLYAMLHVDKGVAGEYEFPGADVPVKHGDMLVSPAFNLVDTGSAALGGPDQTVRAALVDFAFVTPTLTVKEGTTVEWVNNGTSEHTVTADDKRFDSDTLAPGKSFTFKFDTAGTYPYYCVFHGEAGGKDMAGTIIVVK